MTRFDLTPLYRSTIGFDHLAHVFDALNSSEKKSSIPAYNVERTGELDYRISMAVAGFDRDEIQLEQRGNILTVSGVRKTEPSAEKTEILYRGFTNRDFERQFHLADDVKVNGADMVNGLLFIDLVREIPEAEKPRKIAIGQSLKAA